MKKICDLFEINPGEVTVLAGEPFDNCSYLALELAWQKAMQGERVYVYSPNRSALYTMEHACVQMTMQSVEEFRDEEPNTFQRTALAMAHKELGRCSILFDDRETQSDLSLLLQRVERAGTWDLLIIDTDLSTCPHTSLEAEMHRLKAFAAQSNTAVLICAGIYLARDCEDKRLGFADLPVAYRALKNVWLFYRPSYEGVQSLKEHMFANVSLFREGALQKSVSLYYYCGSRTFLPGDLNPFASDLLALTERYGEQLCRCVESYLTEGKPEARAAALSVLLPFASGKGGTYGAKRLGDLYETEGDVLDAIYLWELAALHGDAEAMMQLSAVYIAGELVPQDMQKGYFWLQQASIAETEENKEGGIA